jgi:hypothetical protein
MKVSMKRWLGLAAGLCLALGLATSARAGDDMLKGQVTKRDGNTLTIRKSGGDEVRVTTNAQTTVRGEQGAAMKVDDIETGDQVQVTTTAAQGQQAGPRTAKEIRVGGMPDVSAPGGMGREPGRGSGTDMP